MTAAVVEIPILESERLILRPHRADDFGDCLRLWSDPDTVRFIGGQVQEEQAVWFRMLRYAGMWSLLGFGYWAFESKENGRFLGEGGLSDARRGLDLLTGVPEIGWALTAEAGGKGLATEAVGVIARWADDCLRAPITRCIIQPENYASLRVAEKLGYAEIARDGSLGSEIMVLERCRPARLESVQAASGGVSL